MNRKDYLMNCIAQGIKPTIEPENMEEYHLINIAKSKPFGEQVQTIEEFRVDRSVTYEEKFNWGSQQYPTWFVKVSDAIVNFDENALPQVQFQYCHGEGETVDNTDDWVGEVFKADYFGGYMMDKSNSMYAVFATKEFEYNGQKYSPGVYLKNENYQWVGFIKGPFVSSTITQIPEKFIPELHHITMVSANGKKFNVTIDDSGAFVPTEV